MALNYRYVAFDIDPWDGSMHPKGRDLPLKNMEFTHTLSGVDFMRFSIETEAPRLTGKMDNVILRPWQTLVVIEYENRIIGGCIINKVSTAPQRLDFEAVGMLGFFDGYPFIGWASFIYADPAVIFRFIIRQIQKHENANLGLGVSNGFSSYERVGEMKDFDPDGEEGPYTISSWTTPSCFDKLVELASLGDFDFWVDWAWDSNGWPKATVYQQDVDTIRQNTRVLSLGENVLEWEGKTFTDEYANEVMILGGGKGLGKLVVVDGYWGEKLSRIKVVERPKVTSRKRARRMARRIAARSRQDRWEQPTSLLVHDTPLLRIHTLAPGQTVHVRGKPNSGYGTNEEFYAQVRAVTFFPESSTALVDLLPVPFFVHVPM